MNGGISDPDAHVWDDAPAVGDRPWRAVTIDLTADRADIDMRGYDAVHVTAFVGPDPVGRVIIPCRADVCTIARQQRYLARFAGVAFEAILRREFDETPDPDPPSVSVIVCTRGRPDHLSACLLSLVAQRKDILEIIVVHNDADDDGTAALAAGFPVRFVREPVRGLDRARNRGLTMATGEIVAFTDDDVSVAPDWADRLRRAFSDRLVVAATGLVLPEVLDTPAQIEFERFAGFVRTLRPFTIDGTTSPPAAAGRAGAGASMAFRRSFLLEIGGFSEVLDVGRPTRSGGDTHVVYRALADGYRVRYEPRAVAFHRHRPTGEAALDAVEGYAVGVMSYLGQAALEDGDVVPAIAAMRWARNRCAVLLRASLVEPRAASTRILAAQARGIARSPRALLQARRVAREHEPIALPASAHQSTGRSDTASAVGAADELPDLTVVVPTVGHRRSLFDLLGALGEQAYPGRVDVVVSVDGHDIDEAPVLAAAAPLACRVVRGTPGGAGVARNRGAVEAATDILVFLDDDVLPAHPDVLAAHARRHLAGDEVVVGPVEPTSADTSALTLAARNWWIDQSARLHADTILDFTDLCSGNLSIDRATLEALGGFLPIPRREDYELGLRVLLAGGAIGCAPDATVLHDVTTDAPGATWRRHREGQGDVAVARLHPYAFDSLPLAALPELRGRVERMARLGLRTPDLAMKLVRIGDSATSLLDRSGARYLVARLHGLCSSTAYWAGVGETLHDEDELERLRLAGHDDLTLRRHPELDLLVPRSWTSPTSPAMGSVPVHRNGTALGSAPLAWGGVPFDRVRFVDTVVRNFSRDALRAAAGDEIGR